MAERAAAPARLEPRDWGLVALTVAPLLALVVVAIVSVGHGYHGADDNAMTELRISDIGRHWPTIGPFSRDGWSHPGAAVFYALWLPFRATGSHSNGLLVGAALINAVATGGMVLLARRHGGRALGVLVTLGVLTVVTALGATFLWDPWNPYVTVLPFGLAILATWAVTCGDAWCLPVLVVVGSFCAQTHVGYAPLVAVLLVAAVAGLVLHLRSVARDDPTGRPRVRTPVLVAVALLVLAWAPSVYQQVTADPGNLAAIWHFFRSGRASHGLGDGLNVVTAQFAWNPGWLVGRADVNAFTAQPAALTQASWPVWWIGLAAALVWTWRTGRRAARALGTVLAVTIVASIVAVARTLGPIFEYRLRFVWVLGVLTAVYGVWVLATFVATRVDRPERWARVGTTVVLVAIVALSGYGVVAAAGADPPNAQKGRVVASLSPQVIRHLPAGPGVVVPSVRTFTEGPLLTGLIVDLEHHGIPVRMRDQLDDRLRFGDHRILGGEPVRAELRIAADDQIEVVAKAPCARRLAYWGRAPAPARTRALHAIAELGAALRARTISGAEAFRRLRRWSPDLPAAAVFRTDCATGAPTS
jgi:hypothetical protein